MQLDVKNKITGVMESGNGNFTCLHVWQRSWRVRANQRWRTGIHLRRFMDMKMAMKLHGNNTHYKTHDTMSRHRYDEAKKVSFSETKMEMEAIINSTIGQIDIAANTVTSELSDGFPDHIASPVFENMKQLAKRFR